MLNDNQSRIDAYLRGEMSAAEIARFEADLKADAELHSEYLQTKAIVDALADRKKKLDMMARWDAEEQMRRQMDNHRKKVRRWTAIGIGAAACLALGFFAVRPIFLTNSSVNDDIAMTEDDYGDADYCPTSIWDDEYDQLALVEDIDIPGNAYYRGSDSSMDILDSLIAANDNAAALRYVDSLIADSRSKIEEYASKDSLTEKDDYDKTRCEAALADLEWRRANILLNLGKTDQAKELLRQIVREGSIYKAQADSLLNVLAQ